MRLFTAITLTEDIKKKLGGIGSRVKESALSGNFSRPQNYHITLVFLGEAKKEETGGIKEIMDSAAMLFPPLHLYSDHLGCFKKGNRKILYFDVGGTTDILKRLQSFLYEGFYKKGLCKKQTGYTPHITFARQAKIDRLLEVEQRIEFASGGITLMHSTRIDGRLTYVPIYHSAFNGVFTVDRIEEGVAVLESPGKTFFNANLKYLPKGISSGSKIRYNGLKCSLAKSETIDKSRKIREKFNKEKKL